MATSFLQLGVSVVYSLVSVPLILHWLPKAEFGLWAMLVQLISYIALVDLGINQAMARFWWITRTSAAKEDMERWSSVPAGERRPGLDRPAVVTLGSPLLATMMKIPAEYQAMFIALMRIQGLIAAFTFCMNPLAIMLSAHQRMDIASSSRITIWWRRWGCLLLFLTKGCGIYAFIYANAITALIAPGYLFWHCRRLGFLPRAGEWGKASWHQFKEVFLYGKECLFDEHWA